MKKIMIDKIIERVKDVNPKCDYKSPFTGGLLSDEDEIKESAYKQGFSAGKRTMKREIIKVLKEKQAKL